MLRFNTNLLTYYQYGKLEKFKVLQSNMYKQFFPSWFYDAVATLKAGKIHQQTEKTRETESEREISGVNGNHRIDPGIGSHIKLQLLDIRPAVMAWIRSAYQRGCSSGQIQFPSPLGTATTCMLLGQELSSSSSKSRGLIKLLVYWTA